MIAKSRKSVPLVLGCNTDGYSLAMAGVIFTLLIILMVTTSPMISCGVNVDLARVGHSVSMRGASREDALEIVVARDGAVYFNTEKATSSQLGALLKESARRTSWKKVYLKADARAKYGAVKQALVGVRDAGLSQVGIIVQDLRAPDPRR